MRTSPNAAPIELNRVAVIPASAVTYLTTPRGFDLDHDERREFVIHTYDRDGDKGGRQEFYECIADDTCVLTHTLELANSVNDSIKPTDAGDIDNDGLADFVTRVFDYLGSEMQAYGIRVYESTSADTYPTELVWEAMALNTDWWFGGRIIDGDLDGRQELTAQRPGSDFDRLVYENVGDNSYVETYTGDVPPGTGQSFEVLDDMDDDGRPEILYGAFDKIYAFESIGNDRYAPIRSWNFTPNANVSFIVGAGDLDGDGKKEFLTGGYKSTLLCRLDIFEAVGDNTVGIVGTLLRPSDAGGHCEANVADVDGNGLREIVFGAGSTVAVYGNAGDNAWEEIWSGTTTVIRSIGAGDHDQDGKDEIIFNTGSTTNGTTEVWEIDPAYAADMDGDQRVDAIDNCPIEPNSDQQDADTDAVGDACDNCIYGPNPNQGPAPLGQVIMATDADTFSWSVAADVAYVRGGLDGVSTYTIDLQGLLPEAVSLTDFTVPTVGSGFFYLVKPDCPVGSWQSTIGAEPGRDLALP